MSTQLRAALYIPPRPSYLAEQPSLRQFSRELVGSQRRLAFAIRVQPRKGGDASLRACRQLSQHRMLTRATAARNVLASLS